MTRSALNRHLRTHTAEKPHKCETCCKEFAAQLDIHSKIHHEQVFETIDDLNVPWKTDGSKKEKLEVFGMQMSSVADHPCSFPVEPFGCVMCNEMFEIEKEFMEHCFHNCYHPVEDAFAVLFASELYYY